MEKLELTSGLPDSKVGGSSIGLVPGYFLIPILLQLVFTYFVQVKLYILKGKQLLALKYLIQDKHCDL